MNYDILNNKWYIFDDLQNSTGLKDPFEIPLTN